MPFANGLIYAWIAILLDKQRAEPLAEVEDVLFSEHFDAEIMQIVAPSAAS